MEKLQNGNIKASVHCERWLSSEWFIKYWFFICLTSASGIQEWFLFCVLCGLLFCFIICLVLLYCAFYFNKKVTSTNVHKTAHLALHASTLLSYVTSDFTKYVYTLDLLSCDTGCTGISWICCYCWWWNKHHRE